MGIPDERFAVRIARKQTMIGGTRIVDYKPWRIGVAQQIIAIDLASIQ